MCEESSVNYNHGDVVWVKLGPCWWPGEVVSFDELPSDISQSFKKPPLAVVKFFDEEKYEFVRQLTHIHLYNSNKKYDFIKKGLDLHRAKHGFMDKFPKDVCTAETKTGGDANILNDPKLEPEKKPNYSSIFGSPLPKKNKDSPSRARGKSSIGKHSPPATRKMSSLITHPRFLGKDDSEIRILVQTPSATQLPETEYECYTCGFKSSRIEVIVLHNKSHLMAGSALHNLPKKTKKTPIKRSKKRRLPTSKTATIDEDLALLKQGLPVCSDHTSSDEESSDTDEEPLIKRKAKPKAPARPKKVKSAPVVEVKKQTDIRTDLLAEWDDDEDEEDQPIIERISPGRTTQSEESKKDTEPPKLVEKDEKSCFDFVEDEDDLLTALEGRKIPRVIPPTDKRKSIQDLEADTTIMKSRSTSPKNSEDNIIESETEKVKENTEIENNSNDDETSTTKKRESQFQLEFEAFNNALKETTVPKILDIPQIHKYEQNFHNSETIKFPDKSDEELNERKAISPSPTSSNENITKIEENKALENSKIGPVIESVTEPVREPARNTEVATKLTNPKKRFVKTFEDETKNSTKEENLIQEKKKKEASPEPEKSDFKSLEVSKLKTQLMKKLVEASPKKENLKQIEKSRKNVQKNRRSKVFAEITKIEPAENRETKRSIADSLSENETKAHAKKKKYSTEIENENSTIKEQQVDVDEAVPAQKPSSPKDSIDDKISDHKPADAKTINELEYLNISPTKIFSELHVDKDDLLDVGSLSESQKLTIQNIIGVSSPVLSVQQSSIKLSNDKQMEKIQADLSNKGSITESKTLDEKLCENDLSEKHVKNEMDSEKIVKTSEKEVSANQELSKCITEIADQSICQAVEDKIEHTATSSNIYKITGKMSDPVYEKLPEEIIENPSERTENSKADNDMLKEIATITKIGEKSPEEIEKSAKVAQVEEKFSKNLDLSEEKQLESEEVTLKDNLEKTIEKPRKRNVEGEEEKVKTKEYENKLENKLEKTEKVVLEELGKKEKKLGEENIDQVIIEKGKTMVQTSSENAKENVGISLDNSDIDKQNEEVSKEPLVDTTKEASLNNSDLKKNLQLSLESIGKNTSDLVKCMFQEDEMVNIEGNLTVVTETDLADKQVEIATTPEVSKPITLASFSMDFCEDIVESYVKGETIMQNFDKSKSMSPTAAEGKSLSKDDTHKKITTPDVESANAADMQKVDMEIGQKETIKDVRLEVNEKEKVDVKKKVSSNSQNAENVEIINKSAKLKKFDDIIAPAKDEPPAVIMEDFEEVTKEGSSFNEDVVVDETNLNAASLEKEVMEKAKVIIETCEKVPVGDNLNKTGNLEKEQTAQDIAKEEIIIPPMDISVESEVAKITDSIVEQEVIIQDNHHSTSSTKLLEILTDKPKSNSSKVSPKSPVTPQMDELPATSSKTLSKHAKFVTKQSTPGPSKTPKATILSDELLKPLDESKTVSVKKVTSKRSYQDVEDIDTYIIQKPVKKMNVNVESDTTPKILKKTPVISKGKARILQQTIITPTGDILQPPVSQPQTDDNMFDINSMPIVLSDQILTPESLENMQIVLQENTTKPQISPVKKTPVTQQQVKLLNKSQSLVSPGMKETILKNPISKPSPINKQKMQKVYPSTTATKVLKHNPSVITQPGKQGKFIIVPATTTATGSKYTVGKRPTIVKKQPQKIITPISKTSDVPMTSSGNKIMILKSQGQQQKILLSTPQKHLPQSKIKGRALGQKQIMTKESPQQKGANIISQTIVSSKGQITTLPNQSSIGNRGQIIASIAQQGKNFKIDPTKMKRTPQRLGIQNEITKPSTSGQQRTIIIKNPQGQTVKKIQGTDDALLDQQVAEQLQAISRASANQQLKDLSPRIPTKLSAKKSYVKKQEPAKQHVSKTVIQNTQTSTKNVSIPPLAPISPTKKMDAHYTDSSELPIVEEKPDEPKRPPHQLVIQDAQGNQTTITEGQILALPSEAIDGQPHSYVLVTLDESGNLTPLNSEALMSLDPNLNLTSDLGNMVLQIDQGATPEPEPQIAEIPQRTVTEQVDNANTDNLLLKESVDKTAVEDVLLTETPGTEAAEQNVQAVINSGEMGQLIITGDPVTAQKFLESLAEGNADLANLLANAEGNVLIQADGQQILINTDSENPMLVMNPENISSESSEGSGNPIFASQPVKNQDILAAALADTDVFQQDQSISHSPSKVAQSQLSPNSALYPMNVGNVLETNSMSSPIMTPLEVPSTNSKKIDDENEILNQVPKNVDLPITITDPNISQTVAQQQVASLMATELQTNLDLPLAIQDPGLSVTSAEMSSPSFVYSLPTLDDTVDINQKAFTGSISMPLLTEEPEDSITENSNSAKEIESKEKSETDSNKENVEANDVKSVEADANKSEGKDVVSDDKKTDFINSEGLCAMRGGICNSLSEPPPDMFDFSIENQPYETPHIAQTTDMDIPMDSTPSSEISNTINDQESSVSSVEERKNDDVTLYTVNTTSPSTNTDDSCEIPVQPPIIAKQFEENGTSDTRFGDDDKTVSDGHV